jgi:hypothetical protein
MAEHRWRLMDAESGTAGDFRVDAADVPHTSGDWSVTQRTLRGGRSEGVELVEIDNGRMKLAVLPTRGMGIWRAWMDGRMLGWQSPVRGPVHPAFVPISEPSGLGWLFGFDELMCRCGMTSNGAPDFDAQGLLQYPIHGRIANLPAHQVDLVIDGAKGTISLHGVVEESRFHFEKLRLYTAITTRIESQSVSWHDRIENFGGTATDIQMLYHTNVGLPSLDAGSQLVAAVKEVAPWDAHSAESLVNWHRYPGPQAGFQQQVYYFALLSDEQDDTRVLLKNAAGTSGLELQFNTRQLPCFTQWKNMVASADGYVTGLEPGTNFPNCRSFEAQRGRVVTLDAGASWQARVTMDWHDQAATVNNAEAAIRQLQGDHEPIVHDHPRVGEWSMPD